MHQEGNTVNLSASIAASGTPSHPAALHSLSDIVSRFLQTQVSFILALHVPMSIQSVLRQASAGHQLQQLLLLDDKIIFVVVFLCAYAAVSAAQKLCCTQRRRAALIPPERAPDYVVAQEELPVVFPNAAALPAADPISQADDTGNDARFIGHQNQPQRVPSYLIPRSTLDVTITAESLLGRGAFGDVYRGTFRETPVAIKVISAGLLDDADLRSSFAREAEVTWATRQ